MSPDKAERLVAACPAVYGGLDYFAVKDGWFEILLTAGRLLENRKWENEPARAVQVKQKFGGLRLYTAPTGDPIENAFVHGVCAMAEAMSVKTCEECGRPGEECSRPADPPGRGMSTLWTLCEICRVPALEALANVAKEGE